MNFDCPLAGHAGSFVVVAGAEAAENFVFCVTHMKFRGISGISGSFT